MGVKLLVYILLIVTNSVASIAFAGLISVGDLQSDSNGSTIIDSKRQREYLRLDENIFTMEETLEAFDSRWHL